MYSSPLEEILFFNRCCMNKSGLFHVQIHVRTQQAFYVPQRRHMDRNIGGALMINYNFITILLRLNDEDDFQISRYLTMNNNDLRSFGYLILLLLETSYWLPFHQKIKHPQKCKFDSRTSELFHKFCNDRKEILSEVKFHQQWNFIIKQTW